MNAAPRRKQVSALVLEKITLALQQMRADPTMPRTKRHIEKLTCLSHDTVARAFRQDAEQPNRHYPLNAQFQALLSESEEPADSASSSRESAGQVRELRAKVRDLEVALLQVTTQRFIQDTQPANGGGDSGSLRVIPGEGARDGR